jgi:lipoate-protein ligase A
MQFLNLTLPTPADNLALDEALLQACELGRAEGVLRIWECSQDAVVLGAGCALADDVEQNACLANKIPVLRRSSGGGTVLLGPGCLLYSLILDYNHSPAMRQIGSSYEHILQVLCRALAIPGLHFAGTSDLAIASQKVSGNAQQRKQHYLLHHGTLLYAFDITRPGRYLHMPARQPPYRLQRPDAAFLTNLPLAKDQIAARLREAFAADHDLQTWPVEQTRQLVAAKYGLEEWTRRR